MELELCFDHLADDVVEAEVDVQLLDLGTADARGEAVGLVHAGAAGRGRSRPSAHGGAALG